MLEKILEAMASLTAALDRQTALVEKALAASQGTRQTTAPSTAAADADAEKAAAAAKKKAEAAAAKKAAADAKKLPTEEEVRTIIGEYINSGPGERAQRSANLRLINDHFGVKKFTEAPQEKWPEGLGYIKQFAAGEKASFQNEEAATEDDSPI